MMELTEWTQDELYPRIFERVREVFPEMDFKWRMNRWASRYKLNGEPSSHGAQEKSVITAKQPNRILENGGDSMTLIDFYMMRHSLQFIDAVKQLSSMFGLELPKMEDDGRYRAYKEKQDKLEQIASAMAKELFTEQGREVLDYLRNGRGYDDEFIKWAGFGFVGSDKVQQLRELFTYQSRGQEVCSIPRGTGSVYTMAIPYRTRGRIMGFVFRSIKSQEELERLSEQERTNYNKYKDAFISATATKSFHLFGLTGLNLTGNGERDRDMTVVEGEIDALRASYAGVPNVVAAAGGNLSPEALQEAKKRGVKRVTILFDTEETKEKQEDNFKKAERAINSIQREGLYPLICYLPSEEGKKQDTDSYLKEHTGEQLQAIVNQAYAGSLFLFQRIRESTPTAADGTIEAKDLHEYKRRTIELCNSPLTPPTDRDMILTLFSQTTNDSITKESLQEEADALKMAADKNRQKAETVSLTAEALRLANNGQTEEALSELQKKLPELQRISREAEYSRLLQLPTEDGIVAKFKEKPTGVGTGYAFDGADGQEQLLLPCGALTYICAPTSHGKSRMLENLALQLTTNGESGSVLYFTFEEDSVAVEQELLNIYAKMELSANNLRSLNSYYTKGNSTYFKRGVSLTDFKRREHGFLSLLTSGKLRVFYKDYDSSELIEAIRYLHRQTKVKAVFIDYIQLLHKQGTRLQRKDELKEICKDFMQLAVETQLPIVMAAQLNREAYSPTDMAVQNIAEASDIEQSANVVMLLWNSAVKPIAQKNSYYIGKGDTQKLSDEATRIEDKGFHIGQQGKLYAILAKNRGGARNIEAVLDFNGNTGVITPNFKKQPPQEQTLPLESDGGGSDNCPF